jgi:TrmH family RNA methyltransferase
MAISKNTIKFIKSLRLKKFRQKYNNFIVEGDKISREAMIESPELIDAIYALPSWEGQHHAQADLQERIYSITAQELKKISALHTPNQVLAIMQMPEQAIDWAQFQQGLSLYLDGIQDPGNMGTILRIADWFGITTVLCAKNCVDPYNSKVIQATMGAFLRVRCLELPIEEVKHQFPDLPIFGAAMDGTDVFQLPKPDRGLIVIGNEGNGMAANTEALVSQKIAIPAAANSKAESLNAAVATGIICAAFNSIRQVK